jgi:ketosteroid isomerase-like protein
MEQAKRLLAVTLCVSLWGAGCNQSTSGEQQAAGGEAGPERVVAEFLEAIRTGDDSKAAQLLTPLARKKTTEMEMVVAPPGSDTATFQVHEVERVGAGAQVTADWTDLDADGRPHKDRIIWILRNEADGWRIAGMATQVFADQSPLVLNFEDPADMLLKQQQAEEEIARRDRQQEPQAKNLPDEPAGTVR